MRFFAAALIFFGVAASYAQTPEVPHKIHFAGMSLTIRDDARREIQKDVDALTHHSRYFDMKVERARTYFPIIEKIFAEENLPDDFKYLCLQESALVPDAVSVSNAVGFWQFKDFTAQEMGLRVDSEVDERMNIVSATRGAARYLKQSNAYFNNWILALQSYQMGAGGVKRAVGDKYNGDSHMEISAETYWYVKKYLAHKIAFENAVAGQASFRVALYEASERKLSDIAGEVSVDENLLKEYNKWVKRGSIPGDKKYAVVVPTGNTIYDFNNLVLNSGKASKATPIAKDKPVEARATINGIEAIKALPGETAAALATRAGVDVSRFVKYNDISIDHELVAGTFYFLKRKKKRSSTSSYKAKLGDDAWRISQQFGIRLKNLKKLNPELGENLIAAGTIVRLNSEAAPVLSKQAIEVEPSEVAELSHDAFAWAAKPESNKEVVVAPTIVMTSDTVGVSKKQELIEANNTEAIRHEVVAGETLYAIAQKYSVGVTDIVQNNNLKLTDPLRAGQILVIKPSTSSPADLQANITKEPETMIYVVKSSDTLYGIARQFGATIKEIMDWNNKTVLTVTTGEKLKILKK
ncbi:MAG: LysM peptidoglycan-binding domain-containing protein [Bacteroidetes bacterium]|nr:LysM peptidoglycan-binding domain-containing protein [Bacteroidota bacterium]